jgi:branched-chain amino acid transport system permease protein
VRRSRRIGAAVTAVPAALLATRALSDYGNNIVVAAAASVIIVSGLHLLIHWTGQISLAQVAFVAVGAFVTARANGSWGVALEPAILLGAVAAAAASAVIGLPALRIRGFPLAISTLAFGFAVDQYLLQQDWFSGGFRGLAIAPDAHLLGWSVERGRQLVVPVVMVTALMVLITAWLGRTAAGRALRLVAADENSALAHGYPVGALKLAAFLYAAFCAGLGGGVMAAALGRVAYGTFSPQLSIGYVAAVLLGGEGPVWGSAAMGAALGAMPIWAGASLGKYTTLVSSLGILTMLVMSSGGLNATIRAVRQQLGARRRWPDAEELADTEFGKGMELT